MRNEITLKEGELIKIRIGSKTFRLQNFSDTSLEILKIDDDSGDTLTINPRCGNVIEIY